MELFGTGFILTYFGLSWAAGRYWTVNRGLSLAAIIGLIAMTCGWLLMPLTTSHTEVSTVLHLSIEVVLILGVISGFLYYQYFQPGAIEYSMKNGDAGFVRFATWFSLCGAILFVSYWHPEVDFWASIVVGILTLTTGQVVGVYWRHENFWQLVAIFIGLYAIFAIITFPSQPSYDYYIPAGSLFFLLGTRIGLMPHKVRDLFRAKQLT